MALLHMTDLPWRTLVISPNWIGDAVMSEPLLARLYQPIGAGPFPALVEVHGGAWASGDRLNNAPLDEALAKSGIVVLAIDFRMPPQFRYPASTADVMTFS